MCLSNKYICLIVSLILALTAPAIGGGKLYFVLGSDTGIWEGMDVARYQCHYNPRLFTDATMNAYRVHGSCISEYHHRLLRQHIENDLVDDGWRYFPVRR